VIGIGGFHLGKPELEESKNIPIIRTRSTTESIFWIPAGTERNACLASSRMSGSSAREAAQWFVEQDSAIIKIRKELPFAYGSLGTLSPATYEGMYNLGFG
jgi:hypothetical protein